MTYFSKTIHDDYYTKKETWNMIKDYIPKDKVIWEACLLNTNEQSKKYLQELGFNVVGDNTIDMLTHDMGDVIVTNVPFETNIKTKILNRISKLDKPFCIILNSSHIHTKYFKNAFKDKHLNYIIPSSKIHYDKYNGTEYICSEKKTPWYTIFVTYNLIENNIIL